MDGKRIERVAPSFVGAASVDGRRNQPWFFATLTGFTNPGIVAKYDFSEKDETKRWSTYRTTFLKGLKAEDFEASQVSAVLGQAFVRSNNFDRYGTRARTAPKCLCSSSSIRTRRLMAQLLRYSTVCSRQDAVCLSSVLHLPHRLWRVHNLDQSVLQRIYTHILATVWCHTGRAEHQGRWGVR